MTLNLLQMFFSVIIFLIVRLGLPPPYQMNLAISVASGNSLHQGLGPFFSFQEVALQYTICAKRRMKMKTFSYKEWAPNLGNFINLSLAHVSGYFLSYHNFRRAPNSGAWNGWGQRGWFGWFFDLIGKYFINYFLVQNNLKINFSNFKGVLNHHPY